MQEWEYLIIEEFLYLKSDQDKATERINQLGRQGWELIATVSREDGNHAKLIFKRPKS